VSSTEEAPQPTNGQLPALPHRHAPQHNGHIGKGLADMKSRFAYDTTSLTLTAMRVHNNNAPRQRRSLLRSRPPRSSGSGEAGALGTGCADPVLAGEGGPGFADGGMADPWAELQLQKGTARRRSLRQRPTRRGGSGWAEEAAVPSGAA
ncbi:unnamed protein product, partial [Ectocarpus sp. 8 AP-2014]